MAGRKQSLQAAMRRFLDQIDRVLTCAKNANRDPLSDSWYDSVMFDIGNSASEVHKLCSQLDESFKQMIDEARHLALKLAGILRTWPDGVGVRKPAKAWTIPSYKAVYDKLSKIAEKLSSLASAPSIKPKPRTDVPTEADLMIGRQVLSTMMTNPSVESFRKEIRAIGHRASDTKLGRVFHIVTAERKK